ncbi:MAG TPA: DUF4118 domain-containing protein [Anaerolineales bacterium]|nr:DUF4118 domain-containing protein [Anaerolineales bacterium]
MKSQPVSALLAGAVQYLGAIVVILAATALLQPLRDFLGAPIAALLYLLPVGLTTWIWGLGPGIAASFSAFLAFNYFFLPPYFTLNVHRAQDLLALFVFFAVAVVINQLLGRARSSLAQAQAREREATHLYELSLALAGLHSQDAIAPVIEARAREVFGAQLVRASFVTGLNDAGGAPPPVEPADVVIPLSTARGRLGEISLWRAALPLSSTEERLARAFASQCALALERATLAEAERRAQVLEASDQFKTALLSSVSHELRTPLATIRAAATSLRSGAVAWSTPAGDDLIAAIDDEAQHLNRLVGNLLDMSRIEAGALRPQRQWNILAEIVDGVLAQMTRVSKLHQMIVDIPEDLAFVSVDYVQIEQVFTNLISNSLKYAPPETAITISAASALDGFVRVTVANQGPPVPEEHLGRIFDKFYRVNSGDRVTGTGLGLSICKGIVEAHGGQIWAENRSSGFAFLFTLPTTQDGRELPVVPTELEAG